MEYGENNLKGKAIPKDIFLKEVFSKLWKPGNMESNRESHLSTHLKSVDHEMMNK